MIELEVIGANKRFRSPPYPSLDLAKSIDRARALYGKALHHPVPSNVLADAWKYGVKSSGLWATAAALIQYGLLTDQGSGPARRFTLTDSAMRIIRDADPASEKRVEAIKRAALLPGIFRELWEQFGGADLSDVVIANFLTLDRREAGKAPYGDEPAREIIATYKATVAYAGLSLDVSVPDAGEDMAEADADGPNPDQAVADRERQEKPLTPSTKQSEAKLMVGERELVAGLLSKGASFRLVVTGPVGEKEIERLIKKLELDKEILADSDDIEDDNTIG